MLPDRVSNPGPLTYEAGALPIALGGPAKRLIHKKNSSPLPHWKSPGCMGCYHAIRRDVSESGADQRTDGGHEDHYRAIDFAVFEEMRR